MCVPGVHASGAVADVGSKHALCAHAAHAEVQSGGQDLQQRARPKVGRLSGTKVAVEWD